MVQGFGGLLDRRSVISHRYDVCVSHQQARSMKYDGLWEVISVFCFFFFLGIFAMSLSDLKLIMQLKMTLTSNS